MNALRRPVLRGERVLLRLPVEEDIPAIIRFFAENEAHLKPWSPVRPDGFLTEAYWRGQVRQSEAECRAGQSVRFFIFLRDDNGEVIGAANLSNIVRGVFQAAHLGYSLGQRHVGHGYMQESLTLVIEFAFEELMLHRLMANYVPWNRRSHRVLERLGFQIEGYAKRYLHIDGVWQDHVLTSLINPDWEEG